MGRKKGGVNAEFSPQMVKNISIRPTSWLKPYEQNARTHSETQLDEIAASIAEFGFTNPVLASADGTIIAGHGRVEAATSRLDLKEVPVVILDYLTDAQRRAYIIADNKLALNAGWNEEILAAEINRLMTEDDFDVSKLGFDDIELEDILAGFEDEDILEEEEGGEEDSDVALPDIPVTALGDIWILGNHRLICGDSTKKETLDKLMQGERAALVHTDPPYNVDYSNADRPKPGKKDHGKIKNDKMADKDFYSFLLASFKNAFSFAQDNASAYIWHADRETENFKRAALEAGFDFAQTIIWVKPMLLSRTRYQWAHEPCLFMVKGSPYFTDDRKKTTVWDFGGYDKSNNEHPTQKPTFLPEEAINNSSKKMDVVLDLFGGSGSTLLACEKTRRFCRMVELDPAFCDVIIRRWQNQSGKKAVLEQTGRTFGNMKAERGNGKA